MYDEIAEKRDGSTIHLLIRRGRQWAVAEIDCVAHQCVTPLPARKTPGRSHVVGGTGSSSIEASVRWTTERAARALFARCGHTETPQWILDMEAAEDDTLDVEALLLEGANAGEK